MPALRNGKSVIVDSLDAGSHIDESIIDRIAGSDHPTLIDIALALAAI